VEQLAGDVSGLLIQFLLVSMSRDFFGTAYGENDNTFDGFSWEPASSFSMTPFS